MTGRAGRAGKGNEVLSLMLKTCYSQMAVVTAAWRISG